MENNKKNEKKRKESKIKSSRGQWDEESSEVERKKDKQGYVLRTTFRSNQVSLDSENLFSLDEYVWLELRDNSEIETSSTSSSFEYTSTSILFFFIFFSFFLLSWSHLEKIENNAAVADISTLGEIEQGVYYVYFCVTALSFSKIPRK